MPLTDVDVTALDPQRFRNLLSPDALAGFERAIERGRELLDERTMWNVNSTARGGGVAEMLKSLLGYVKGAGRDGRWTVITGDPAFFAVTKRLHNRLHGHDGDGGDLGPHERDVIVNALQRRADVVAQKSLAEGFGLTVAEAMWKARPVVASRVGGIQDQIDDGRTGHLVEPHDAAGFVPA